MSFNPNVFSQAFAQAYQAAQGGKAYGTKAPGTGPGAANWIHGPGGLFGSTAVDEQIISARVTPRGISQALRSIPSLFTHPEFGYITGIDDGDTEAEPSTKCATCPSGEIESCVQTAPFGYICRETDTLTPNRAIERINRADVDLMLVNDMIGRDDLFQPVRNWSPATILQVATALSMLEVGVLLQNRTLPMVWQGTPANNVGTGYAEFIGLDLLISTGKVDAHTGTTCPALDSYVASYGWGNVNATDAAGNFRIVRELEYLEAYLYHNADRMSLLPTEWAVAMRPELWYELTNIWPTAYLTTRNIVLPAGNTSFIDSSRVREMMDEMRSGLFIFLNGRQHRVILDDGIYEYTNVNNANVPAGSYASNIYMVPLSYMGGRPGTYFEHKDYRSADSEAAMLRNKQDWWSDDGRFEWVIEQSKWCYTLSGKVEPRIVLRTPQLAGRLDYILYTPATHFREPWPDSPYFYKGGEPSRPTPSLWNDYTRTLR